MITVLYDVMLWSLKNRYRGCGGTCLYHQGTKRVRYSPTLNTDTIRLLQKYRYYIPN